MKIIKLLSKRIVIIFAAVLILAAGIRMVGAYKHNYLTIYYRAEKSEAAYKPGGNDPFPRKFKDNGKDNPYKAKMPLHEMDFSEVMWAVGGGEIADNEPEITDPTTVLNRSIKYYEKEGSKYTLAYEIPKGARIIAINKEYIHPLYSSGYGISGFPTYEKGWRYVVPFKIAEEGDSYTLKGYSSNKYYVRLSDLEAVMDAVYEEQPYFQYWDEKSDASSEIIKKSFLLFADYIFFRAGTYCSPDFYHPYFDTPNIALLSAGGTLLVTHIGARGYLRRKRKDG